MKRRDFLKSSSIGAVGAGVLGSHSILNAEEAKKEKEAKISHYRTLGRTGFKVSDLSAGIVTEEGVLNAALDAGINYIDTAEMYMNGRHETLIGKVMKNRDRKKYFITSKLVVSPFIAKMAGIKDISKKGIIERFHKSLQRLQTDYLDCLMMHADQGESLKNNTFFAAAKELKSQGKLKFIGVSNHGAFSPFLGEKEPAHEVLLRAAEDKRLDVFLIAYNYLNQDKAKEVVKACKKNGIGVTLMKTNPVGNYFGLKEGIDKMKKGGKEVPPYMLANLARFQKQYEQAKKFLKKHKLENPAKIKDAAIKFCLSNPDIGSVVLSIKNFDDLNRYLSLSGEKLTAYDHKALDVYSKSMGEFYCRHACGVCEEKCPQKVPINTIMRYNHYFVAQGREKYAMSQYKALPTNRADKCSDCSGACESVCPYNIPVQTLLTLSHQNLVLA